MRKSFRQFLRESTRQVDPKPIGQKVLDVLGFDEECDMDVSEWNDPGVQGMQSQEFLVSKDGFKSYVGLNVSEDGSWHINNNNDIEGVEADNFGDIIDTLNSLYGWKLVADRVKKASGTATVGYKNMDIKIDVGPSRIGKNLFDIHWMVQGK